MIELILGSLQALCVLYFCLTVFIRNADSIGNDNMGTDGRSSGRYSILKFGRNNGEWKFICTFLWLRWLISYIGDVQLSFFNGCRRS